MGENRYLISILVESVLGKRLKFVDEADNMDLKTKVDIKKGMIETFIKETIAGNNSFSENEIREVISELLGEMLQDLNGEDR